MVYIPQPVPTIPSADSLFLPHIKPLMALYVSSFFPVAYPLIYAPTCLMNSTT